MLKESFLRRSIDLDEVIKHIIHLKRDLSENGQNYNDRTYLTIQWKYTFRRFRVVSWGV